MFFTYVLQSESTGRFYIGSTKDISGRLAYHNAGRATATKSHGPWRLAYVECFETLSAARRREYQIKSWKSPVYMAKALGLEK